MRLMHLILVACLLTSCNQRESVSESTQDLNDLRNEFLNKMVTRDIDEGPFNFNYNLRTIFFSNDVISLFGKLNVHDCLPHGWKLYEGKTVCKIHGRFQEVFLSDLFKTEKQKEFLRKKCEEILKKEPLSYFSGKESLRTTMKMDFLHTFVIDHQNLILIFQPYSIGNAEDGIFFVKIPFAELKGHWDDSHPFLTLLQKAIDSHVFISSWDLEKFYDEL